MLLLAFLFVILPVLPLRGQEVKKIAILETVDRVDLASIVGEHDFQRTGMVSDSQIK